MTEQKLDIDENGKYISPPPPGTIVYVKLLDFFDKTAPDDIDITAVVITGRDLNSYVAFLTESPVVENRIHARPFSEFDFYLTKQQAVKAIMEEDLDYHRRQVAVIEAACKKLGIDIPAENTP